MTIMVIGLICALFFGIVFKDAGMAMRVGVAGIFFGIIFSIRKINILEEGESADYDDIKFALMREAAGALIIFGSAAILVALFIAIFGGRP